MTPPISSLRYARTSNSPRSIATCGAQRGKWALPSCPEDSAFRRGSRPARQPPPGHPSPSPSSARVRSRRPNRSADPWSPSTASSVGWPRRITPIARLAMHGMPGAIVSANAAIRPLPPVDEQGAGTTGLRDPAIEQPGVIGQRVAAELRVGQLDDRVLLLAVHQHGKVGVGRIFFEIALAFVP